MPLLSQLFSQLRQQLDAITAPPNTIVVIEIEHHHATHLLAWLKGQTLFPQFFWQARDQSQTLTSLGCLMQFDDLQSAQQFSQQHQLRLVGGIQFEGGVHFILPRLLLCQTPQKLTACLYLNGADFAAEKMHCQQLLDELSAEQSLFLNKNQPLTHHQNSDFASWQQTLHQAQKHIEQSEFRKVVLANAVQTQFADPVSPYDLLAASQQKNHGCYHFLWAESASNVFIGSSPECLYQRQQKQLYTEALAGTVASGQDSVQTERNAQWLLHDHKNRYENQLVVQDICEQLSGYIDELTVGEVEIKPLKNVQHLRRQIRATLADKTSDADCLRQLHPTAAVAGLPRQAARTFIARNEGFKRGWYAGTLGFLSPESAEFCVTIRSVKCEEKQLTFYAGAGIVSGSEPFAEWQEIERKIQALRTLLVDDTSHSL